MDTLAIMPSQPAADPPTNIEKSKRKKKKITERVLMWLVGKIAARPLVVVIGTILVVLAFLIGTIVAAELDKNVPDLFPTGHNQVLMKTAQEQFSVTKPLSSSMAKIRHGGHICRPSAIGLSSSSDCILHWCESPSYASTASVPANDSVSCWWPNASLPACRHIEFRTRIAATAAPTSSSWSNAIQDAVKHHTSANSTRYDNYGPNNIATLSPLVVESWDTGKTQTSHFYAMGSVRATYPSQPVTTTQCVVDTVCFQGAAVCAVPGWVAMGTLNKTIAFQAQNQVSGGRLLQDSRVGGSQPHFEQLDGLGHGLQEHPLARRLLSATGSVPVSKRVDVTVIWGVRPTTFTPLVGAPPETWRFDPTFEPSNPWAQRAMFAICDENNIPGDLLVVVKKCWVESFRKDLIAGGQRFPTRNFEQQVSYWWGSNIEGAENIWRKGTEIQAAKVTFILNVANDIAAQPMLDHKQKWDKWIDRMNAGAAVTADQAYHTASAWVRAEAEVAVVASTVNTIIVAALCAWLGMALFTQDPVLACLVLGLVLGIVLGLAFFMVVIMGWKIGSIEVISLVIFLGYSVTYSLHVAHSYAEVVVPTQSDDGDEESASASVGGMPGAVLSAQEQRKIRATLAIVHIGTAVLSSALSTFGSSIFLLFCTMVIFVKLGAVVIAVTVLSIVCALVVLPAFLMLMGPPEEPWISRCKRCLKRQRGARLFFNLGSHES